MASAVKNSNYKDILEVAPSPLLSFFDRAPTLSPPLPSMGREGGRWAACTGGEASNKPKSRREVHREGEEEGHGQWGGEGGESVSRLAAGAGSRKGVVVVVVCEREGATCSNGRQ